MLPRNTLPEQESDRTEQKGPLLRTENVLCEVNEILEAVADSTVRGLRRLFSKEPGHDAGRRRSGKSGISALQSDIGVLAEKVKEISALVCARNYSGETSRAAEEISDRIDVLSEVCLDIECSEATPADESFDVLLEEIGLLADQIDLLILGVNSGGGEREKIVGAIDSLLLSVVDSSISKELAHETASLKNGLGASSLRDFTRDPYGEFIELSSFEISAARLQVRYQNEVAALSRPTLTVLQAV